MNYTDVHAHLADERVLPQLDAILAEGRRRGMHRILANAARRTEWPDIAAISAQNSDVYGALGLHPFFLNNGWDSSLISELQDMLESHPRCVAVGEIGLDFYHGRRDRSQQLELFAAQVELAVELGLPIIVHNRKSWGDFFGVLRDLNASSLTGVCHHFSSSIEIARQALDAGLYLSFCGPLTNTNARRIKAAAAYVPIKRLLTETDTPDLASAKHRGRPSRPWHVAEIAAELAAIRGVDERVIISNVAQNFSTLLTPHSQGCLR